MSSVAANIGAALGALVKVAPEKPTMPTAFVKPGVFSTMSTARRTTASVRSSEEPGGSWIATIDSPGPAAG